MSPGLHRQTAWAVGLVRHKVCNSYYFLFCFCNGFYWQLHCPCFGSQTVSFAQWVLRQQWNIYKAVFGCWKTFPENTYFPEMLISGKGKCFHGVWLHFKKFSGKYFLVFGKEEGKHKSRKIQATTQEKIINDNTEHRLTTAPSIAIRDCDRRRDRDLDPFARLRSTASRDRRLEIAINDGEIADWRLRSPARSLSHFPEILWRENRSVKWFSWSKAFFLGQRISISKN